MAHWFHRNVLKATVEQKFDFKVPNSTDAIKKLCSDLRLSRNRLLELIRNPNNTSDTIEPAFQSYLSLLYGFIWEVNTTQDASQHIGRPSHSKLRNALVFKWTHTLLGSKTYSAADTVYEVSNMSINVGLWFMKHAAMIASKDDVTMNEAKEVHRMLRRAAGIFAFVQTEFLPELSGPPHLGSDLDARIINAYINQCTAEAQEVTVARAIEMKHNSTLISALANETSKLFLDAANTLQPFKPEISAQWIKYLELKAAFYQSYAYNYLGEDLLSKDKCGQALRALKESMQKLNVARKLCVDYSKTKGPAPYAKPDQHVVFKRLAPIVRIMIEKCERENSLIYHESVPDECPPLETKATFGLVSPLDFQMPTHHVIWNSDLRGLFSTVNPAKVDKEKELPPVKEEAISHSEREPKNESGCSLQ